MDVSEILSDQKFKSTAVEKTIEPRIDLGNLLIEDQESLEIKSSISNEELQALTRDNCQCLFNEIWKLQTKRVEEAVCVALPVGTTRLPREKPLPQPKAPTKWEQYAQAKGIRARQKEKLLWDENTQSWKPRYGYRRGNDETKDWLIEIPDNQDPYKDYFGERQEKKRERMGKNEMQRLRNLARNKQQYGPGGRGGGANYEPLGVFNPDKRPEDSQSAEQFSHQMDRAKTATASKEKFQEKLKDEKAPRNKGIKRKFAANEGGAKSEREHQLEILKKMSSKKPKIDSERIYASQEGGKTGFNSNANDSEGKQKSGGGKSKAKEKFRGKSAAHKQKFFQQKLKKSSNKSSAGQKRGQPSGGGKRQGGKKGKAQAKGGKKKMGKGKK